MSEPATPSQSVFSVVATPIGNLEDITLRALNVLKSADLVLCEDTRVTKKLFAKYDIKTPALSYHAHSTLSRVEEIIAMLREGKHIALVSDAGTPGISDPGSELVSRVREECQKEISEGEIKIETIPGPSALVAALSIAGVRMADFTFLGFLPHKKGRETLFREIRESERTMVFYESPHRIMKTLESLAKERGEGKREAEEQAKGNRGEQKKITVCRELTKIFEEVVAGSAEEVRDYFISHRDKIRGEFVVVVSNN